MTKKLFVVLVLITAMLVSFSLVMAAKKAPRGIPEPYVKPIFTDRQDAVVLTPITVEQQTALQIDTGRPDKVMGGTSVPVSGALTVLGSTGLKDFCDLAGGAAWFWTDWLYGAEYYANYQDPEDYGCTAVWPFEVTEIVFQLSFPAEWVEMQVVLQGYVFADIGPPECPEPEPTPGFICATPAYGFTIPTGGGYFQMILPMTEECCVYGPYFAVIEIVTDLYGLDVALVTEDGDATCLSYNDYGTGWLDLGPYAPGPLMLFSTGYTSPQNECPTEGDSCFVTAMDPPYIKVLQGDAAVFTANVAFQGSQTECYLVADPDPVCPDCDVTVFNPNPVVDPGAASQVTIQTAVTTPPGVYAFEVNGYSGAKGSGTIEVVAPSSDCEMYRDNEAWTSFWGGWVVGDQQVVYFDPEDLCVQCDDDVYPFDVDHMKVLFYDHEGVGSMDYIFKIYASTGDPCDGPQGELLSWPVNGITQFMTWLEFPLPEIFCVDGPFFFAMEFNNDPGGYFPCALWTGQDYGFDCTQWVFYGGAYVAWEDMWVSPSGYMSIRAVGTCDAVCPIACYMSQDQGNIAWFNSAFEEGDEVVKYYNPEDYCEPPVYPYNIQDLDFLFYEVEGGGSVPVVIHVYLECQDSCDGPGTEIFVSDPFVPDLYGAMAHVDFDEPICVYEPFYIGWEYLAGVPGTTPSPLFMDATVEPAEYCHAWFYKVGAGYWIEHWDFWGSPDIVGYPLIRVSGSTNHPLCDPPPCDTTLETLWGAPTVQYFFKQPVNEQFMNMQFEMPADHGGSLEGFEVAFYDYEGNPSYGTPDPDLYVWLSDGTFPLDNNPPYQAIAEFHKDFTEIVWFPGYTEFDAHSYNLIFDPGELFHIGGSHAHEAGDTLAWLGCAVDPPTNRASSWDGSAWGDFGAYEFIINAIICPIAPDEPTFSMRCTPSVGYATPGDPPVDVYTVEVGAVLGYAQNVTLSLLDPGVDITATFSPNGIPPDFDATVAITVGGSVSYGSHPLTFQGVGDDAQTKTCNVTLIAQPPYDEDYVDFFHGKQTTTNFGALANANWSDNFLWNGMEYLLYDGSIISAVPGDPQNDHMALDMYDCEHVGFIPTQHMIITDIASCVGTEYEELYGEMAYSNFYTEEGEWDSLFIIGLRDVESTDFSIKIKIYYNPDGPDIPELWAAVFEDWDIGDAYSNWGDMDPDHNLMYQWDPADPGFVFGIMRVPFDDLPMQSMVFVYNPEEVYPTGTFSLNCGADPGPSYMFDEFMVPGLFRNCGDPPWNQDPDDHSIFMASQPFSLLQGEKHIEIWIDFGRNLGDGMTWEQWYKKILRYVGMYRGDVNASDTLELPALDVSDLVYLVNYLYKGGPAPLPFADQGNVDGKGPYGGLTTTACPKDNVDLQDLVYLLNFIYKGGPAPVDYVRYIEQFWSRPSLFLNPLWN